MKFFSMLSIVLCCNVAGSLAQTPPTPDQIAAAQAALALAANDAATYQVESAQATADAAATATAQATQAADTATAAAQAAKVNADVQAAIAALQTPDCPTCKKAAIFDNDDQADMAEAVARGFGSRFAIGPHKDVTLAIRGWRAQVAVNDPEGLTKLNVLLGRGKLTPCQKATAALIGLEMVNAFSPGTIPPTVIALAVQLQQQACAQAAPKLAAPQEQVIPLPPKKHATGLILPPVNVRNASHVKEALIHRAYHSKHGNVVIPDSLDLRSTITPIEDQGQVGTCHDFSGVDTVTFANIKAGNLTSAQQLSTQYIVDLAPNNDGTCSGGDASSIFQWLKGGNGIPQTAAYAPYTASCNQGCQLSTTATGYTISDWGYADTVTGVASVLSVQESLVTNGVTSVCIGCPNDFMNYSGGIYNGDLSSGIDHQISLVGYTIDPKVAGGGYWILRNSWGTGWGENGYARISFASNPTTEAMWNTATKGQTTVVQPWGNPQPTPTRRAGVLMEKATRLYLTDPDKVRAALKAAEDVLQNAP